MQKALRSACFLLLCSHLATGCMLPVEPSAELDVEGTEQALGLKIAQFVPTPPKTEIPDCWWVDDPDACDEKPECTPPAPVGEPPARVSNLTLSPQATRASRSSASTAGTSRPSTQLDLKAKDPCPSPDGVPTCSTCTRSKTNPWRADLELSLASRVLVTNGLNSSSYFVKNYPILNAYAYAEEGAVPHVNVDLSEGVPAMQSGSVDLTQDLYMFFTSDFEEGVYPVGNWVFCPKNGNPCVQLPE